MSLNPLVEKIYQNTVQKSLDLEILNDLDFENELPCDSAAPHACTGEVAWKAFGVAGCPGGVILICDKARAENIRFAADGGICAGCENPAIECWIQVPIEN